MWLSMPDESVSFFRQTEVCIHKFSEKAYNSDLDRCVGYSGANKRHAIVCRTIFQLSQSCLLETLVVKPWIDTRLSCEEMSV